VWNTDEMKDSDYGEEKEADDLVFKTIASMVLEGVI